MSSNTTISSNYEISRKVGSRIRCSSLAFPRLLSDESLDRLTDIFGLHRIEFKNPRLSAMKKLRTVAEASDSTRTVGMKDGLRWRTLMAIRLLFAMLLSVSLCSVAETKHETLGSGYIVGAAKADITPPPGFPTGGHGSAGAIARGSWSRLWARAFFIKQKDGPAVVLVSCDFFAEPLGLTAAVWRMLTEQTELVHNGELKPEGLVIAATHTHQGPGNYMSSASYNGFGSVQAGFSEELFDFLAHQILAAIQGAAKNAQPATLHLYHKEIWGGDYKTPFLVNRSPGVFMLNWDANSVLAALGNAPDAKCDDLRQEGEPKDGWDLDGCPRLRAINRRMVVLEAHNLAGERFADLVFFAVHPTVLDHSAPLYNSDFTGYAMDALEAKWGGKVMVGFFNGAEGDITPRRIHRDINEVRERGEKFQGEIESTLSAECSPGLCDQLTPMIVVRARLIDRPISDDRHCPPATNRALRIGSATSHRSAEAVAGGGQLAEFPIPGTAMMGGGELDRTAFYDLGWKEGVRDPVSKDNQGTKKGAIELFPGVDPLRPILALFPNFAPVYLPITYIKMGKFSLGALPVEMSTTGGYRIRQHMENTGDVFQLVGLANEYVSYSATASEYAAQDYMGASTLWGPGETEFFACQLADLREQSPGEFKFPDADAFDGGILVSFHPSNVGQSRELPDEDLGEIIQNEKHVPERNLPLFQWREEVSKGRQYKAAHQRELAILGSDDSVVDDTDAGFVKVLKEKPDGKCQTWHAIWVRPLWQEKLPDRYRFQVTYKDDQDHPKQVKSKLFTVPVPQSSDKPQPRDVDGDSHNPCNDH
jgi:neutral ceramidase